MANFQLHRIISILLLALATFSLAAPLARVITPEKASPSRGVPELGNDTTLIFDGNRNALVPQLMITTNQVNSLTSSIGSITQFTVSNPVVSRCCVRSGSGFSVCRSVVGGRVNLGASIAPASFCCEDAGNSVLSGPRNGGQGICG